jgi:indole-3-glycerol phosphate synthase
LTGARRFSEAISEGDGISVIVQVADAESARAAEDQGAEAIALGGPVPRVREATALPILWVAEGPPVAAREAGADACVLRFDGRPDDDETLEARYAEAVELGLDCVVAVTDEDELEIALERVDPEIVLLGARSSEEGDDPLEQALDLLPDVPAGKLAVADVPVSDRDTVVALERAGVDAVIVGGGNVSELVSGAPPEV